MRSPIEKEVDDVVVPFELPPNFELVVNSYEPGVRQSLNRSRVGVG